MKLGVIGLVCFLGMSLISFCGILADSTVPADRRLLAATIFGGFWLLPSAISAYLIVSCRRESWYVNRLLIRHAGVFRTREIVLSHVNELRWICSAAGTISLKSPRESLRVSLESFTQEQRLWLIRMLREIVPESRQVNWEQFCGGIAVRLNPLAESPDRPLKPDEGRFTRGRCDLYFGLLFAATLGVVLFLESDPDRLSQRIIAPIAIIALWLLFRFQIPRSGLIATRLQSSPKFSRWIWGMLAWSLLPLIWLFSAGPGRHEPIEFSWQLIMGMICYLVVFGWMVCKADRETVRIVQERRRLAAREWQSSNSP